MPYVEKVLNLVKEKMSYSLLIKEDPRNLIKRCPNPNCGLVWLKVAGCDGETNCGNRGWGDTEIKDEINLKSFLSYTFSYFEGKLSYSKKE